MEAEYAQRSGESYIAWLNRVYEMARTISSSSKKGWTSVDPKLIAILLDNMRGLLPRVG